MFNKNKIHFFKYISCLQKIWLVYNLEMKKIIGKWTYLNEKDIYLLKNICCTKLVFKLCYTNYRWLNVQNNYAELLYHFGCYMFY